MASETVLPTVVFSSAARRLSSSWVVASIRTLVLCMQISIHIGWTVGRIGVGDPPVLDDHLGLAEVGEVLDVEQLVTKQAVDRGRCGLAWAVGRGGVHDSCARSGRRHRHSLGDAVQDVEFEEAACVSLRN